MNFWFGRFIGLFVNFNLLIVSFGFNLFNKVFRCVLISRLFSICFRFIILSLSCLYFVIYVMLYDLWLCFFLRFFFWLNLCLFFFVWLCNMLFMIGRCIIGFFLVFNYWKLLILSWIFLSFNWLKMRLLNGMGGWFIILNGLISMEIGLGMF